MTAEQSAELISLVRMIDRDLMSIGVIFCLFSVFLIFWLMAKGTKT